MKTSGARQESAEKVDSVPEAEREFAAFCQAEYPALLGTLSLLLGDRWQAEDLSQEALARTWLRWPRVRTLDRPDLWARRVALNLAHSWWHRQRTASLARANWARATPLEASEPRLPDLALYQAIAALTPRQRPAIVLRYLFDMSVADAAVVMGCREGTVKALTSQAIAVLRKTLGDHHEEVDRP